MPADLLGQAGNSVGGSGASYVGAGVDHAGGGGHHALPLKEGGHHAYQHQIHTVHTSGQKGGQHHGCGRAGAGHAVKAKGGQGAYPKDHTGAQHGVGYGLAVQAGGHLKADHAENGQDHAGQNGNNVAQIVGFGDIGGHPGGNAILQHALHHDGHHKGQHQRREQTAVPTLRLGGAGTGLEVDLVGIFVPEEQHHGTAQGREHEYRPPAGQRNDQRRDQIDQHRTEG